ncbi:ATP-binding protein [Streptosporangium subroseum]|uniref:ATP-binding protein n=1 Tax=Streptosporangium subroseum TaxID=106412 RepID=UPI00308E7963|nr:ATP-binding protein [Streptosporangium subroseum]
MPNHRSYGHPFIVPTARRVSARPPRPVALTLRGGYAHACHQFETTVRHLGEIAVRSLRDFTGPVEEPGIRKISWSLSPVSSSVPRARHLVRTQLAVWAADEQGEIIELLVSELVTNTLRHAWGPIRLALRLRDGILHCEVQDANPALPHMRDASQDDEGGRGMHLLDLLSQRWGSVRMPAGKVIWFELSVHEPLDVSRQPRWIAATDEPPVVFPRLPSPPEPRAHE